MAAMAFRRRARTNSLSTVTPPLNSVDYDPELEILASRILYKSPLPSPQDLPVYILDSAVFPDVDEVNYDALLPYVITQLPSEEQLIGGKGYEVIFFAGGEERAHNPDSKKRRPGWSWLLHAYQILSRAMRKRLQRLYLVHERRWIRLMSEAFSAVVSPKFRRKLVHCSTLSSLALHLPIEDLLIPPTAYDRDRKLEPSIHSPYATGRRAFGASRALPTASDASPRLPRVLRETTTVLLDDVNIKSEGLFRVNGRAQTVEVLKEAYDRGQKFIIWREGDRLITFDQWKEGHGEVPAGNVEHLDGYGVYTAASLTKSWYSSLREPIFPHSSYVTLARALDESKPIELPVIIDMVSASSDWSPIPKESRLVLTMHLFPMLSKIAQQATFNKMTATNLAVCFAPALLCGPDPVEDAKMTRAITRFLERAIENWDDGLVKPCEMSDERFKLLLKLPDMVSDREDPLSSHSGTSHLHPSQSEGIVLIDKDDSDSSDGLDKPPLPPRILTQVASNIGSPDTPSLPLKSTQDSGKITTPDTPSVLARKPVHEPDKVHTPDTPSSIKRKPAPPIHPPPRYSTIISSPTTHGEKPVPSDITTGLDEETRSTGGDDKVPSSDNEPEEKD